MTLSRALAPLALLALVACASVEAAAPAPAPAYEPHPAIAIVERLADTDDRLPDVAGLEADEAVAVLADLGLTVQVVAFDEGEVTAQHPEPGARLPADGQVVVWTGTPPAPPPRPVSDDADSAGAAEAEEEPAPADETEPEPAPEPEPEPETETEPAPQPTPEPEPETATAPEPQRAASPSGSRPARTSPRQMPGTESGTVLEGLASWYGPGFAGRTTACGQRFDPDELTLATRELRCGTRVQITGPRGTTVEAVVTDWGPAEWTGRRFDLSRATFQAIHSLGAGVVHARVEVLP